MLYLHFLRSLMLVSWCVHHRNLKKNILNIKQNKGIRSKIIKYQWAFWWMLWLSFALLWVIYSRPWDLQWISLLRLILPRKTMLFSLNLCDQILHFIPLVWTAITLCLLSNLQFPSAIRRYALLIPILNPPIFPTRGLFAQIELLFVRLRWLSPRNLFPFIHLLPS